MSSLKEYLAKNYMSTAAIPAGAQKGLKKSKKLGSHSSGRSRTSAKLPPNATTTIVDEDADDVWGSTAAAGSSSRGRDRRQNGGDDDGNEDDSQDDSAPAVYSDGTAAMRFKPNNASWVTVQPAQQQQQQQEQLQEQPRRPSPPPSDSEDEAEYNAESAYSSQRRSPSASAQTESSTQDKMQMSDGTRAGLQSGAAIREHFAAQRREQQERLAAMDAAQLGRDAPTVHRDKLGRIIDPEALRAEMLAEKARKEKEEQERIEWGKGVAQRQAKEAMEKRLIEERTSNFAVYRDDVDYNRELMARDRWGDPMAFMTSQNKDAGIDGSSSKHKRSRKREVYKGPPPPPNRYGIAPGYRWDGVDRSNGFEAKFFQAKHAKAVFDDAAHKWSIENM